MYPMLMSNATHGVIGLKKGTQAEVCHWCYYIYGPSLRVEFICEMEHTKHSKYFLGNKMSAGSFSWTAAV